MAMALGNVYHLRPHLPRRERATTPPWRPEFWIDRAGDGFCRPETPSLESAEAMTRYVISADLLDNCPDELAFFNQFLTRACIERLELVAGF